MILDIENLRKSHAAAGGLTDCKVTTIESDPYRSRVVTSGCLIVAECNGAGKEEEAAFIALAHNTFPALLDELDKRRGQATDRDLRAIAEAAVNGELSTSRVGELVNIWRAGNFTQDQLPPVRRLPEVPGKSFDDVSPWDVIEHLQGEMTTLRTEINIITEAARAVRDAWESGDLAGAVRWMASLLDAEPEPKASTSITAWQTGRWYSRTGQRIAALREGDVVYFSDVDRCVSGSITGLTDVGDLQDLVMFYYDRAEYSPSIPIEIRDQLDAAARKVEAPAS